MTEPSYPELREELDLVSEQRDMIATRADELEGALKVTDEMVERAARAMWMFEFEEKTGLNARESSWPDAIEFPDWYRDLARRALAAALHWKEKGDVRD